jgi:DNA-binding CsgD family transcriptional regulator
MPTSSLVDVIEAAYAVEQPPAAWLARVVQTAVPHFDRGTGICGYFVDAREGRLSMTGLCSTSTFDIAALMDDYRREVPLEIQRRIHTFGVCAYGDQLPDEVYACEWVREGARQWATLGVNCLDASLEGCVLTRFQDRAEAKPATVPEVELWSHVATHLAAGARLVRRLQGAEIGPGECVLSPSGRVVHADGEARARTAREALREAVLRNEHARSAKGRARAPDAIEAWRSLVGGRWTLVDHFETDGRRYLLAEPNEPIPSAQEALSQRERQAAVAAALGHSDKLIAYELGIAPSTVARLLSRARTKLGAPSRVALVQQIRALERMD